MHPRLGCDTPQPACQAKVMDSRCIHSMHCAQLFQTRKIVRRLQLPICLQTDVAPSRRNGMCEIKYVNDWFPRRVGIRELSAMTALLLVAKPRVANPSRISCISVAIASFSNARLVTILLYLFQVSLAPESGTWRCRIAT